MLDINTILAASGAIIVPVTALLLNYRGFNSLERRMERLEDDLKEFYKIQGTQTTEISRLKDHTGLK